MLALGTQVEGLRGAPRLAVPGVALARGPYMSASAKNHTGPGTQPWTLEQAGAVEHAL